MKNLQLSHLLAYAITKSLNYQVFLSSNSIETIFFFLGDDEGVILGFGC